MPEGASAELHAAPIPGDDVALGDLARRVPADALERPEILHDYAAPEALDGVSQLLARRLRAVERDGNSRRRQRPGRRFDVKCGALRRAVVP